MSERRITLDNLAMPDGYQTFDGLELVEKEDGAVRYNGLISYGDEGSEKTHKVPLSADATEMWGYEAGQSVEAMADMNGQDIPITVVGIAGKQGDVTYYRVKEYDTGIASDKITWKNSGQNEASGENRDNDPAKPDMTPEIKHLVESEVQRQVAAELQGINAKFSLMEEENKRLKKELESKNEELEAKNRQIEQFLAAARDNDRAGNLTANDLEARLRPVFPQNYLSHLGDFAASGYRLEVDRAASEGRAPMSYKEYTENLAKREMDHLKESSERKKDGVYERIDQPQVTQAELARYLELSYRNSPDNPAPPAPQPTPTPTPVPTPPAETPPPAQNPKSYTIVETRGSDILSKFRSPKRVIVDNATGEEEVLDEPVEVKRRNKILAVAAAAGFLILLGFEVHNKHDLEELEHRPAQPAAVQPVVVKPNIRVIMPKQKPTVVIPPTTTEKEPPTTTTETPPTTTEPDENEGTTTTPSVTPPTTTPNTTPAPSDSSNENGFENEGGFQIRFYNDASGNRGFGVLLPKQIDLRRSNSDKPYYSLYDTRLGRVIVNRVTWDEQGNLSSATRDAINSWNGEYEVEQGPFDFKTPNKNFSQHFISRVEIEANH